MNKTVRVLMPTEIPGITDYVDDKTITEKLNCYLKHISDKINFKDLGDWRLLILINSRATSGVGIYKRVRRYPSRPRV